MKEINYISLIFILLVNIYFANENKGENKKSNIEETKVEIEFNEKVIKCLKKYNYYNNENSKINKKEFIKLFHEIIEGDEVITLDFLKKSHDKCIDVMANEIFDKKNIEIVKGNELPPLFDFKKLQKNLVRYFNGEDITYPDDEKYNATIDDVKLLNNTDL